MRSDKKSEFLKTLKQDKPGEGYQDDGDNVDKEKVTLPQFIIEILRYCIYGLLTDVMRMNKRLIIKINACNYDMDAEFAVIESINFW